MKSQLNVIEIDNPNVRMEAKPRPKPKPRHLSKKERLRIQERKRQRAKKRRRMLMIRFAIKLVSFLAVIILGRLLILELSGKKIPGTENIEAMNYVMEAEGKNSAGYDIEPKNIEAVNYKVGTPRWLEDYEIDATLKGLSEQYDEFRDIYKNKDAYPEDLLFSLSNNPEMIEFVKGYLTSDGSVTGGLSQEELSTKFPLLLQWDTRWGYASYGDNNIALSGCAPTCLSMVVVELTGNENATPNEIADFAMSNGYYMMGTGTMWSLMTEGCLTYGVQGQQQSLDKESIFSNLREGNPIICSVRPGDFTTGGHFIVLTGIEDGKIKVNDPNCRARSNQLWDYEVLEYQIKNLWVFTKSPYTAFKSVRSD